jgi:hypothetical protein
MKTKLNPHNTKNLIKVVYKTAARNNKNLNARRKNFSIFTKNLMQSFQNGAARNNRNLNTRRKDFIVYTKIVVTTK